MQNNCAHCGKEHYLKPAKAKARNFCSHACYWLDKRREVSTSCLACAAILKRKPCTVNEENFCDLVCRSAYRRGENHPRYVECQIKKCAECNNDIPHRSALNDYAKYCSRECKNKGVSGKKNYYWRGGVAKIPYPKEFSKIRPKILERDKYKCQICGCTQEDEKNRIGRNLSVHHIDANKLNNNPSNLITSCHRCNCNERDALIKKSRQLCGIKTGGGPSLPIV